MAPIPGLLPGNHGTDAAPLSDTGVVLFARELLAAAGE